MKKSELLALIESSITDLAAEYRTQTTPVCQAIAYALAGQGKRVRPLLTLLFAEACGAKPKAIMPIAVAIEMVHLYSLIHDDLPCMDDDNLRRGRATVHVEFNEAQALLAGDGLLTDAFGLISASDLPAQVQVDCIRIVAQAAGPRGMVGGQSWDLHWTARRGATRPDLDQIHGGKTAALIAAACQAGALAAGGKPALRTAAQAFGYNLGMSFQIRDDLIDHNNKTGKTAGKDHDAGKLTYLSHLTHDQALAEANRYLDQAIAKIKESDLEWGSIAEFAEELRHRNH